MACEPLLWGLALAVLMWAPLWLVALAEGLLGALGRLWRLGRRLSCPHEPRMTEDERGTPGD